VRRRKRRKASRDRESRLGFETGNWKLETRPSQQADEKAPVMLSVTWALGPPMEMKVPRTCHSDPAVAGEESAFAFTFTSRFLVAALLGMTRVACSSDFRGSAARHLLFLVENKQKQIPLPQRRDRDDVAGAFFISLAEFRLLDSAVGRHRRESAFRLPGFEFRVSNFQFPVPNFEYRA
jgi:hypothetical protein